MVSAIQSTGSAAATAVASSSLTALRTRDALGRLSDTQDPAVTRQAATHVLSELFFKPMLAEMRDFPLGRDLATGGQGEAAFAPQLDQRLADTVAASQRTLVDQIVRRLDQKSAKTGVEGVAK